MPSQYADFIDVLIKQRNFSDLTPEEYEEIRTDAMERLDDFLLDHLIDALSDEDGDKFVAMMEEKKPMPELVQFAKEHIPDYEEFVKKTLIEFSHAYTGE